MPAQYGALTVGVNYLHIIKQYNIISADAGSTQLRGNIGSSIDQGNLTLVYDKGPVSWFNQIRYIGPALFDASEQPGTRDVPGVPSYVVWNTSVAFKVTNRATFQVNIDNVTNRGLPFPGAGNASQNIYTEGLFGRTFLARFSFHY